MGLSVCLSLAPSCTPAAECDRLKALVRGKSKSGIRSSLSHTEIYTNLGMSN